MCLRDVTCMRGAIELLLRDSFLLEQGLHAIELALRVREIGARAGHCGFRCANRIGCATHAGTGAAERGLRRRETARRRRAHDTCLCVGHGELSLGCFELGFCSRDLDVEVGRIDLEQHVAAPASWWRGTFESAAVVSGTNRNAKPMPVTASGQNRSAVEVDRLMSACIQQPSAVRIKPNPTSHDGRIWL